MVSVCLAAIAGGGAGAGAGERQSPLGERITDYVSNVEIARNGEVTVTEDITYDFGSTPRHGILRHIPIRFPYDDVKEGYDRVTPLDVIEVSADPGTPDEYSRSTEGNQVVLKVGDPDRTITGVHRYRISYRLQGALNHFADHDELYLNITGNDWPVLMEKVSATVKVPGAVEQVACFAGPVQSRLACAQSSKGEGEARFAHGPLAPSAGLTVVVGFPVGVVSPTPKPILEQRRTLASAFALRPDTVVPAGGLAAAAVGGFVLLLTRVGRDRRYTGSATDVAFGNVDDSSEPAPLRDTDPVPVEFVPPEGLRPGQVGTLIDEQANTLDVTATIVDLAVRGYLRITEIPKEGWFGSTDWQLDSLEPGTGLKEYENTLLTALFAKGPSVTLSELKNHFAKHLKAVEEQLYEDMMANRWYRHRPDQVRTKAGCLAVTVIVAGIVLTIVLALFTSYALLGLPVVLLGLLLVFANKAFPARTPKGYATVRRIRGFKQFIDESEKDRAAFAERQHLFSEYLPYAVVFGAVDKWARTFAGLNGELPQTNWYVSPYAFNYVTFSGAMSTFTTSTAGTIASTPGSSGGSGFGGGGFSGGGVGGGGGGSW